MNIKLLTFYFILLYLEEIKENLLKERRKELNKRVIKYLFLLEKEITNLIVKKGRELYREKKGKDVYILSIINEYILISKN